MKIFIFIEWALFHSQSLCYVINVCILYLNIYCMYVGFWLNTHIFKWRTGSGDIKILFCLHKFPNTVTEFRACGTESPAIVGKARYAFAQLLNHYTRTVPTTILCMYVWMDGWMDGFIHKPIKTNKKQTTHDLVPNGRLHYRSTYMPAVGLSDGKRL